MLEVTELISECQDLNPRGLATEPVLFFRRVLLPSHKGWTDRERYRKKDEPQIGAQDNRAEDI